MCLLHHQIMRGVLLQFPRDLITRMQSSQILGMAGVLLLQFPREIIQMQSSQILGMAGVLLKPMTRVLINGRPMLLATTKAGNQMDGRPKKTGGTKETIQAGLQ